ncbi:MAG TPA: hemolysin family protein [Chitinophagaceae bacterium]
MTEIFIIIGLILLNGLFSMAEIALVSARKARLETQAAKGDAKAREALELANHPDTFLSTVQIGITLIGILTGIFSGQKITGDIAAWLKQYPSVADYSNGIATTIVVVVVTYLTLVLGELLPKRIGLANPEKIAKMASRPMRFVSMVTYPFIWLLTRSTNLLTRLFNLRSTDNQVTEEEIKAIISEGTEHGAIEEAEQEIIERVFHLGDRNITSLMTHRSDIIWLDMNTTVAEAKETIASELHTVYPVCDGRIDDIKGIVSIKDMYLAKPNTRISSIMRPAQYVPENNSAYQVLEFFKKTKAHYCFIVDEYGSVEGMITFFDILEAIVGDTPETGDSDYEVIEREDGSLLVDGQLPFYDLLSKLHKIEWMGEDERDFDTVAGFILNEMQRIPTAGDCMEWKGLKFEIVDMDGHRIDKVIINIPPGLKEEIDS